jgi:DNA-binding LacI/PurR family transcriptional regulator
MKQKACTIKDIAQTLNINISTVSRALNNSNSIKEETRKLVHDLALKLNYRPNAMASSLRKGKGNTIGLIVPNINRHFFSNLIYGVETVLGASGYNILICQSTDKLEKEKQAISTLINARVDGIIISITSETEQSGHIENAIENGIVLVQVDRVLHNLNTHKIVNNNFNASYNATKHLLAQGYKKIAHLSGPQTINIYKERQAGYSKALLESDLNDKSPIIYENTILAEKSYELVMKLHAEKNLPDAFFSASDFGALGALQALQKLKIKVPETIGIVGYANEPFTELTTPSISSIDQYSIEIGKEAAQIMLNELKNKIDKKMVKQISIEPLLIIRDSSKKMMNDE